MTASSEEVGEGNCTSLGTGTSRVTSSTGGVWYEQSVGGDNGGEGKEVSCLWSISSAYNNSEVALCPQRHNPCSFDSTWALKMVNSTSRLLS